MGGFLTEAQGLGSRPAPEERRPIYVCDRCGFEMIEHNCKIVCPNCGSRYDCSDLSIYFDEPEDGQWKASPTP